MRVAVLPAFDEERTVGTAVLKADDHVDHVLVVDDGSADATSRVAERAGATVVPHDRNRGKGAAVATGIEAALKHDPDVVVLLDADGQHDPDAIPSLVEPIEQDEADLVVGSRTLAGDGTATRPRRLGRTILDRATNAIGRFDLDDTQSGFRAVRGAVLPGILPREQGMGVESEMLLAAAREDLRIVEVPVADHYPADATPRVQPGRHAGSVVGSILRFVREEHPLAFFGGIGAVLLLVGTWLGYETATLYYGTGLFAPGKAMLAMLFIILGSMSLLGAMVLDFIGLQMRPRTGE